MYHEEIVARRLHEVQKGIPFELKRFSVPESLDIQYGMPDWNEDKKQPARKLKDYEQQFIINEIALCTWDFRYWMDRYSKVMTPDGRLVTIELWDAQETGLKHISDGEKLAWEEGRSNGWVWCKCRQAGATQLAQNIMVQRLVFHENQRGVMASDAPTGSQVLRRRFNDIMGGLPWWMYPSIKDNVKTTEGEAIHFDDLNSTLVVGHGRKMGGGIAQGNTTNVFHFTELPDWENYEQIDADFMPTFHLFPNNIGIHESTARVRDDHWHDMFTRSWEGRDPKLRALFIPVYLNSLYVMNPPTNWVPRKATTDWAAHVLKTSPSYCFGKAFVVTKEQMYWWEMNYINFKKSGNLATFYSEYPTDHFEAFQHRTIGMFGNELINEMQKRLKPFQVYHMPSAID